MELTAHHEINHCSLCKEAFDGFIVAIERMFGFGGEFQYGQCYRCRSLTLQNPPNEMKRYYPADKYYSFADNLKKSPRRPNDLRTRLAYARNEFNMFRCNLLGALVHFARPGISLGHFREDLWGIPERSFGAKILDVGCGSGEWLLSLARLGFSNLYGIDPFIVDEFIRPPYVHIYASTIEDFSEHKFDFINMSHSLEHIHDQLSTLLRVRELLRPGGISRVEIPVCDSDVFEQYREHWIELDAPRHFILHTECSMTKLCRKAGLQIVRIVQTGSGFEYWGSELYKRNITYFNHVKKRFRDPSEVFTPIEINEFRERARLSLMRQRSGRRAYYLRAT